MTRIYLAGPMSGIPRFNFPAFWSAAAALRAIGYDVVSPAEIDPDDVQQKALASPDGAYDPTMSETWGDSLARDVKMLADGVASRFGAADEFTGELMPIDGIVFLPGWEKSKGARLEAFVGTLTGKRFFEYDPDTELTYERNAAWVQAGITQAWRS